MKKGYKSKQKTNLSISEKHKFRVWLHTLSFIWCKISINKDETTELRNWYKNRFCFTTSLTTILLSKWGISTLVTKYKNWTNMSSQYEVGLTYSLKGAVHSERMSTMSHHRHSMTVRHLFDAGPCLKVHNIPSMLRCTVRTESLGMTWTLIPWRACA